MVADFYGVDMSTIDRYLSLNSDELKHNGYVLCKGKSLKEFELQFACLIYEASKTTQLGLFNFRVHPKLAVISSCDPNSFNLKYLSSLNPSAFLFITFILLFIPSTFYPLLC